MIGVSNAMPLRVDLLNDCTMECNKVEAIRAKEMAEKRMGAGDFLGAKRIALKAQKLHHDLENISQLLTVCDVHCSALNKVNGLHMDWYGILQVERFSDDAAIRKQYRKLALSLHPDKNKFPGAEAAFKLIGEANRLLTDCTQRLLFDTKLKHSVITAAKKQPTHLKNMNPSASKQSAASNNFAYAPYEPFMSSGCSAPSVQFTHAAPYARFSTVTSYTPFTSSDPHQQDQQPTFWTSCCFCNSRFQCYKDCLNRIMRCSRCQKSFTAYDFGPQAVPPGSQQSQLPNQKGVANKGSSRVAPEGNGANTPGTFVAVDLVSKAANFTGAYGNSNPGEKANQHMNIAGMGRKRKTKSVEESDDSSETASSRISEDVINEEIYYTSQQPRRSRRQRQDVSYKENLSDDDDFVNSPTMTKGNSSSSNEEERNGATLDDGVHKDIKTSSSTDSMAGHGKDVNQKASALHEESLTNKESRTGEDGGKEENITVLDNNNSKSEDDFVLNEDFPEKPGEFQCPDPEFGDFDKDRAERCFAVNQIWAIYDPIDGMPRFYAKVKKLFSPDFRVQIAWLEPAPDDEVEQEWCDAELPVACGKYATMSSEETDNVLMFSHQICINHSARSPYLIYPRKGEIWALFKKWSLKWRSDPKKHKPPYQFEYVAILSDFIENAGTGVSYLKKIEGFVSLFNPTNQLGIIPARDLYKFSHRVPSFRMTGMEREGVPKGSFELDPAALQLDPGFDNRCNSKMENDSLGGQTEQTS